ncbi:amidase family protein, partial [Limnobacter sp.]|uniref:amidase n=1 Tax=Limnobacter sp. TaxID=2003368 RepID=UPI00339061FF
ATGALFGLPVLHKDSFMTKGLRTTFGSRAFENHVPTEDSAVVRLQKAAGAITLGKTNLPEFGAGSHTFNAVFGATHNPYKPGYSPGGSSGGSAAALAAGFVPLADGSDMGGSLRNPASFCNVVGIRPSLGRVPMSPTGNAFNALTVGGPMARNVRDLALYMLVLCNADGGDPLSGHHAFSAQLQAINTKGLRIAYSANLGGLPFEPAVQSVVEQGVRVLTDMGCTVEEAEPQFTGADDAFDVLRALAFATSYAPLRAEKGDLLKKTVRWNIDKGLNQSGADVARAERMHTQMFNRMRLFLQRYDFLVCPVSQVLPFPVDEEYPIEINGQPMDDYVAWMRSASRISLSGHPAMSVPCGFTEDGFPVGLQIVGRYGQEQALMEFALQFETANPVGKVRPAGFK